MLIRINDRTGVFAPQYYGSVRYYAALAAYRRVVVDAGLRFDKRFKSVHRCTIIDTRAELTLTVPVAHRPVGTDGRRTWRQMGVSAHGEWWNVHRVSLESAYGRTPFFEFYIDRFMPWLRYEDTSIVDFDLGLDEVVRRTLGLETEVSYSTEDMDIEATDDHRSNLFPAVRDVVYYQVRADRLGFHPDLSILDLLFNMGPEAPLVLRKMAEFL
ncbi:MAG: WbqC family protein [Muribaculaceae bacterium]|nr:WbqC family protein [Muribaculaceae bacterium]